MVVKLSEIDDLSRPEHHFLEPGDRCFFLWEYTPNRGYKFSEANNLILNFKKSPERQGRPEWRYKEQAMWYSPEASREDKSAIFKKLLNKAIFRFGWTCLCGMIFLRDSRRKSSQITQPWSLRTTKPKRYEKEAGHAPIQKRNRSSE